MSDAPKSQTEAKLMQVNLDARLDMEQLLLKLARAADDESVRFRAATFLHALYSDRAEQHRSAALVAKRWEEAKADADASGDEDDAAAAEATRQAKAMWGKMGPL